MSEHHARLHWARETTDFAYESYDRSHTLTYGGGTTVRASSAAEYRGNPAYMNPEEALVGALSSCHMLTFLAICARKKIVVDAYEDEAVGHLEKNAEGRLSLTRVILRPRIAYAGSAPTREAEVELHHQAHLGCFIANSVKTEVTVESRD